MCAPVGTATEELLLANVIEIVLAVRLGSATLEDVFLTLSHETTASEAELLESFVELSLACSRVELLECTCCCCLIKAWCYSKCLVEVLDGGSACCKSVNQVDEVKRSKTDFRAACACESHAGCFKSLLGTRSLLKSFNLLDGVVEFFDSCCKICGGSLSAYILKLEVVIYEPVTVKTFEFAYTYDKVSIGNNGINPLVLVAIVQELKRSGVHLVWNPLTEVGNLLPLVGRAFTRSLENLAEDVTNRLLCRTCEILRIAGPCAVNIGGHCILIIPALTRVSLYTETISTVGKVLKNYVMSIACDMVPSLTE